MGTETREETVSIKESNAKGRAKYFLTPNFISTNKFSGLIEGPKRMVGILYALGS